MDYKQVTAELISENFKLRHFTSPASFPAAFLCTISNVLKPQRHKASKSKLYYQIRTQHGLFKISPTGSISDFDTQNTALAQYLQQCVKYKDTIQAYISYSAGDCIDELNEVFIELVRENCRQFSFLRKLIDFVASRSTVQKIALEILVISAAAAYCYFGFKLVKWLVF